jgi:hypothetical protein
MAKEWVVTYPGLGLGDCRLHEPNCPHLSPSKNTPFTGMRRATPAGLKTQQPCKVCERLSKSQAFGPGEELRRPRRSVQSRA